METDMVGKYLDPGCAQGVGGVVNNTAALAENMKGIVEALNQVSDVVSHLSEQTACFEG